MIHKLSKKIVVLLTTILIFGNLTAILDYYRISNGKKPIYNIKHYIKEKRIEENIGLFYKLKRTINTNTKEPIYYSSNIEFQYLFIIKDIKINVETKHKKENILEIEKTNNCNEKSKLIYADLNIKIYKYCINDIKVIENNKKIELTKYLENNNSYFEEIKNKLYSRGTYNNEAYIYEDNKVKLIYCNKENINDIYIMPIDSKFQEEFCTYKD